LRHVDLRVEAPAVLLRHLPVQGEAEAGEGSNEQGGDVTTITQSIRYGWHDIKEQYEVECRGCGKRYKRTTSTGYNETASADYRADARVKLKAEAQKLSQEKITCNACLKAALAEAAPVDLLTPDVLEEIADIEGEQAALDQRKKAAEKQINQHRNRLFLYEGQTYVQYGCSFCPWNDGFTVDGCRLSKVRPWETTDHQVHAPITQITYLDETLDDRKANAKAKGAPA